MKGQSQWHGIGRTTPSTTGYKWMIVSMLGLYRVVQHILKNTFILAFHAMNPVAAADQGTYIIFFGVLTHRTEQKIIIWHKNTKPCKALNCLVQLSRACIASLHSYYCNVHTSYMDHRVRKTTGTEINYIIRHWQSWFPTNILVFWSCKEEPCWCTAEESLVERNTRFL